MSKCKTFLTLVVGLLFSLPAMAYSPPGNANIQHTTKIELKPASFLDMSRAYKTAAVCFLGVGDCDNEISYGKGGDGEDYTVDTAAQCKNEGFILNNCNSVQVPEGYCPYNKSYVTRCKCASNLVTCPAGQVGVGESCGGKYASCKCDPALKTCSSKEVGQGASCGGKYQSCACKSEYAYNTSNCTSPRSPSGDSCSYGCQSYFSDCSSKCQTCKTCNYTTECGSAYRMTSCAYGVSDSCTACGVTKYVCKVKPINPSGFICNSPSRVMKCNGMKCCCPQGVSCTTNYKCFCEQGREAI